MQVLCWLSGTNFYSHEEELSFCFCFCINEIAGFLATLTAFSTGFKEPIVGVGLVFFLANGNTTDTSSGLCHHLSSCSKSNCASDRPQRWLFVCSSNCQHMIWLRKAIVSMANVFYTTVSLNLMDVTCHSHGCVKSTDSHTKHWQSELFGKDIYSVLHSLK